MSRANTSPEWKMSLLQLKGDGSDLGWYHLSISKSRWILRKLPSAAVEDVAQVLDGDRRQFPVRLLERYRVERQLPAKGTCQSVVGRAPGITDPAENRTWGTIAAELTRRHPPKPSILRPSWPHFLQKVAVGVTVAVIVGAFSRLVGMGL